MRWTFLAVLMLTAVVLGACLKPDAVISADTVPSPSEGATVREDLYTVSEEAPLMASADSEEEARELAELYGIQLVEYSYGVATFDTDEDPAAVIARGKRNGWPALSLNGTIKAC